MIWDISIDDDLTGEVKEDAEEIREILNEHYIARPGATISSSKN